MSNIIKSTADCLVTVSPYTLEGSSSSTVTYSKYALESDKPVFATHLFPDGTIVVDLFQDGQALSDLFQDLVPNEYKLIEKALLDSITTTDSLVTPESISPYFTLVGGHSKDARVVIGDKEYDVFRTTVKLTGILPKELFYSELGYVIADCIYTG